jgi:hypothetical protein
MYCSGSTCRWWITCGIVSGESSEPTYRLTILGAELEAYDLSHARIVVSSAAHSAIGDVQIRGGSFEWTRSGVLGDQTEAELAIFIDTNSSGACDVGEPAWEHVTGLVTEDTVVDLAPRTAPWEGLPGECTTSGGTDLTMPMPCSP